VRGKIAVRLIGVKGELSMAIAYTPHFLAMGPGWTQVALSVFGWGETSSSTLSG
jgi:hypothetical protein